MYFKVVYSQCCRLNCKCSVPGNQTNMCQRVVLNSGHFSVLIHVQCKLQAALLFKDGTKELSEE